MSRAYAPDEVREHFLGHVRHLARYWAELPDKTPLERTEGMAHSMLVVFDGSSTLPAFDIVVRPHPDDKQFNIDEGKNYYADGMVINDCKLSYELVPQSSGERAAVPSEGLAIPPEQTLFWTVEQAYVNSTYRHSMNFDKFKEFHAECSARVAVPATEQAKPGGRDGAGQSKFNAQRLRDVAILSGLESTVSEDDSVLDSARGVVLGMIAYQLRRQKADALIDAQSQRDEALTEAANSLVERAKQHYVAANYAAQSECLRAADIVRALQYVKASNA